MAQVSFDEVQDIRARSATTAARVPGATTTQGYLDGPDRGPPRAWRCGRYPVIAAMLFLLAGAAEPVVVLRGRIEDAVPGPPIADEVHIGTATSIRLRIRKVEAGSWPGGRTFDTVISMASLPRPEKAKSMFLVVEQDGTGWKTVAWNPVATGLCFPDGYAAAHGLADDLPRLRKRGVLCCDW